jgi:hypothetical protein
MKSLSKHLMHCSIAIALSAFDNVKQRSEWRKALGFNNIIGISLQCFMIVIISHASEEIDQASCDGKSRNPYR